MNMKMLYKEPEDVTGIDGKKYTVYYPYALDLFGDGLVIYYDKERKCFRDDGITLEEVFMIYNIDAKEFFSICDKIVQNWYCNVNKKGEVICKDPKQSSECLMQLIQAITALITLTHTPFRREMEGAIEQFKKDFDKQTSNN